MLQPHGLAVEARYRAGSTRQVKTQLASGQWAERTVFTLTTPTPAGVAVEEAAGV